jgi:hypothetical protein
MENSMKKLTQLFPLIAIFLAGCGTLHDQLADMSMQKKKLADGSPVSMGINIPPAANWRCNMVTSPKSFNWASLNSESAFTLGNATTLLMDKALAHANQQGLKINYINLQIPPENSFNTGSHRFQMRENLTPNANAFAGYYQCQRINPEHRIGMTKSTDYGVLVD